MKNNNKALSLLQIIANEGPIGASTLCENLDYSQATVGRLLRQLEKDGLVCKVANKGRILTQKGQESIDLSTANDKKNAIANQLIDLSFSDSKETLLEIMAIRSLLEPYTVEVAARCATEKDIEELENLAFAHRYTLSCGIPANKEDLKFHLTIARIAANQTLIKILELLLTENSAYVQFSKFGEDSRKAQVASHFRILEAIKNKDTEEACQAMISHMDQVSEDVKSHYQPVN